MSVENAAPDHSSTSNTAPCMTRISNELYLADKELERLYERMLGLENEAMALRMAEVLRRYFRPDDDCGIDVLAPSEGLPDYPQVIAFDLQKMPLPCIMEVAEVIAADERLSAKH